MKNFSQSGFTDIEYIYSGNFSEPILPDTGYTYIDNNNTIKKIIAGFMPIWIVLGLGILYWIVSFIICCYSTISKWMKKKYRKVNCVTEIHYKDKSKDCDMCIGHCTCTHEIADL